MFFDGAGGCLTAINCAACDILLAYIFTELAETRTSDDFQSIWLDAFL